MHLLIEHDGQRLFELDGNNALTPTNEGERTIVFKALLDALAVLARIKDSYGATEAVTGEHSSANSRCPEDHRNDQIVHLVERRDSQA